MGSALMRSLQSSCFWQRDLLGTPVNLLLSSQKCQGVPFSPICQNSLLLKRPPLVLTPCPQPRSPGACRLLVSNIGDSRAAPRWAIWICITRLYPIILYHFILYCMILCYIISVSVFITSASFSVCLHVSGSLSLPLALSVPLSLSLSPCLWLSGSVSGSVSASVSMSLALWLCLCLCLCLSLSLCLHASISQEKSCFGPPGALSSGSQNS